MILLKPRKIYTMKNVATFIFGLLSVCLFLNSKYYINIIYF